MQVFCSFCHAEMAAIEPLADDRISHGLCEPCHSRFLARYQGQDLGEYLHQFEFPVLLLNENRRVLAANEPLKQMLGKKDSDLFGLKSGEALVCKNARTPAGCGTQIYCHTCSLRLAVSDTWDTCRPYKNLAATLQLAPGKTSYYRISTEKRDDLVVVAIEERIGAEPAD